MRVIALACCVGLLSAIKVGNVNRKKPSKHAQLAVKTERTPEIFEAWYVNLESSTTRKQCMEKQLSKGGMTPHRWAAVEWPEKCAMHMKEVEHAKAMNLLSGQSTEGIGLTRSQLESCMHKHQLGDCLGTKGISMPLTGSHGTLKDSTTLDELRGHVVANWCSHKRLFNSLVARNTSKDYFVVLEDDTILTNNFKQAIDDFVQNYKDEKWSSVQIDPWGKAQEIGDFKGKKVFRPFQGSVDPKTKKSMERQFYGMHAWLIKKDALPKMIDFMENSKTIPIDWIPQRQPQFLAWKPNIAKNPESGKGKTPEFCDASIRESTIAR